MEEQQKKISLPEIIVMGMLVISAYLLGVFANFAQALPVIGQAIMALDWVYDLVVFAAVQLWLILKGGIGFSKQVSTLIGNLAEFVPFLNALPLNIIGFFLTVYLINHPRIAEVIKNPEKGLGAAKKMAQNPQGASKAAKESFGAVKAPWAEGEGAENLANEYV